MCPQVWRRLGDEKFPVVGQKDTEGCKRQSSQDFLWGGKDGVVSETKLETLWIDTGGNLGYSTNLLRRRTGKPHPLPNKRSDKIGRVEVGPSPGD